MWISFVDESLWRMSGLATLRRLEPTRVTPHTASATIYTVPSHGTPGAVRVVEINRRDQQAKCSCPSKTACSHIACALADFRPSLVGRWMEFSQDRLNERLEANRAIARRKVAEHFERHMAAAEKAKPELCTSF